MRLRVSRRALGAVSFVALATAFAGCSSDSSSPTSPTTAGTPAPADAVLSGSYTTMADAYGAITRYSFDDDGTYKMARIPCDQTTGACSDQGTYTVDTTYDSVTFVSSVTGATTTSAMAISDVDDGDDDADDDAGTTTTKDLVTGDAGSLFGGSTSGKTAQSFVLTSAGSALFTHESPVLDQLGTSNCWIYTAMGWSAALANFATPSTSHQYSPAYIYYWHQFDELVNATQLVKVSGHNEISWGGYWSQATELALQYGMMSYGAFVSDDAKVSQTALTAINKSLKTGNLSKAGALSNRTLVRAELDKAWGLSGTVIGALDTAFGADVSMDFTTGATAPSGGLIFPPSTVTAELTNGALSVGLLNAAIGTPADDDRNTGPFAWTNNAYPAASTNYVTFQPLLTKILKVLNDGFAIPFEWYADSDSEGTDGSFKKAASASNPSDGGLHYSIIADYQVTNVPGFGTLEAGSTRTAAQKTAALDPAARVSFLRIKNSWGTMQGNAGYNDLYLAYIDGNAHVCTSKAKSSCYSQQIIDHVVLPPGY